ncbi:MAG TPA: glycerol-3-phosphate dehydrogenase/oxidase [Gemmatimonadaceae bacterium]|nr:glycerol-3-phosphate dehydrogenase/oxidase [Gemmatimonadaceae bacterium]
MQSRASTLARLARENFDVLVIGGGITGAGVARDAALRGLRVALVERDDWASGTSSRSSRLVHGGVRYLEHGHLHLVFESSRERRTLLTIAPHLVRPLPFTWPVYEGARVPRWKLGAGLLLYDALSLFRNVAPHERLSAAEVSEREPALLDRGLVGGARYYDASTDDARLTLANAVAAAEAGAAVLNHAPVRALLREGGRIVGATIGDALDGDGGASGEIAVRARVVVNATGPWGDALRRLDEPDARDSVRGSKGVHVSVPRDRVGNRGALTLLAPSDGRVMFVLPAGAHAIVGTTETATTAGPDDVRATAADVAYLLAAANAFFPDARLTTADVVSAWAGIRPLASSAAGGHGAAGSASREHAITTSPSGVISVSGGKLTTYRSMAAEIVDAAERALGHPPRASDTARQPLPGGDVGDVDAAITAAAPIVAAAWRAAGVLPNDGDEARRVAARLVGAHGSRWREVWALAEAEPALAAPVAAGLPYVGAELRYAVARETACTVADLLVRRTPLAFETRDHGRAAAARAAEIVAGSLGWSNDRRRRELASYDREATRLFAVDRD